MCRPLRRRAPGERLFTPAPARRHPNGRKFAGMIFVRSVALAALSVVLGLPPASGQGLVVDSDRMQVMTDTPEYCWHLASEVAATPREFRQLPPEVRMLALEGQRMCDRGLIRGGILRLRRALLLLRSGQ
jgi:hypothetical protein